MHFLYSNIWNQCSIIQKLRKISIEEFGISRPLFKKPQFYGFKGTKNANFHGIMIWKKCPLTYRSSLRRFECISLVTCDVNTVSSEGPYEIGHKTVFWALLLTRLLEFRRWNIICIFAPKGDFNTHRDITVINLPVSFRTLQMNLHHSWDTCSQFHIIPFLNLHYTVGQK